MQRERCKKRWTISRLLPPISRWEGRDRIDNEYEKRREKEGGNGIRRRKRRVDGKLMPGINSRRVFINQNRDRVKNPTEMYAFSALRLGRMRNKQRDKHYEVAAVEASSVINAARHPVHTHTRARTRMHSRMRKKRERKRKRTRIHALGSCQEFMRIGRIYRPRKTSPSPEESRLISIRRYFIVTSYYCAFLRCGERRKGSLDGFRSTIFSPYIHTYIYTLWKCVSGRRRRGEAFINYFE